MEHQVNVMKILGKDPLSIKKSQKFQKGKGLITEFINMHLNYKWLNEFETQYRDIFEDLLRFL